MHKSKFRDFIPSLNKEVLRLRILNEYLEKYSKEDILNSYCYKTTKYDPLVINEINGKKVFSKKTYNNIILKINEKNENFHVKKSFEKNIIILNFKNTIYKISQNNYNRIKNMVLDHSFLNYITFDDLIWALLNRYSFFDLLNGLMGSVLPERYLKFKQFNENGEIFECFGSFLNHTGKNYCGLFTDLEKYFGNVGNFFDTKFISGLFLANPPFTIPMINKVSKFISKNVNKATFIIIIPTWRIEDRERLNKVCKMKLRTDYVTDVNIDPILKHKKFIQRYLYCKESFPYYDFIDEAIRYFASTDILIIGNPIPLLINEIEKNIFPNFSFKE